MDATLRKQCNREFAFALPDGSVDEAGQVQTGTLRYYKARVEPHFKEVFIKGVEERTSHMLIVDERFPVTVREAIGIVLWIPGEDDPEVDPPRIPKVVHPCFGERGELSHWEILV